MIVCFSGTGNSAAVARQLSPKLEGKNCIVWVCPVHAWGLPRVVLDAIVNWPEIPTEFTVIGEHPEDAPHWLVLTCGDDVGRAPEMWRKALAKKGLTAKGAFSVRMPNTYVNLPGFDVDTPQVVDEKLKAMPARVEAIAAAIAKDRPGDDVVPGAFPGFKTKMLYPIFNALLMSPKRFKVNEGCTRCGVCARACPMHNITMCESVPTFGPHCTTCMACYHACPGKHINRPFTHPHGQYRYYIPR